MNAQITFLPFMHEEFRAQVGDDCFYHRFGDADTDVIFSPYYADVYSLHSYWL